MCQGLTTVYMRIEQFLRQEFLTRVKNMTQTLVFPNIDNPTGLLKNKSMRSRMMLISPRMGPIFLLASILSIFPSCALLFPDRTAPKSASYTVKHPSDPWKKLSVGENPSSVDAMKADLAFENTETGAVISLNSICRKYNDGTLETLTLNLVRGIEQRVTIQQNKIKLKDSDALDSLFEGIVDGVKVRINTIVTIKNQCTFDFIYVEVPKDGKINTKDFQSFVTSFQVD